MTGHYPRGALAEKNLHREATDGLLRTRTPEQALAVVLRLRPTRATTPRSPSDDLSARVYKPL